METEEELEAFILENVKVGDDDGNDEDGDDDDNPDTLPVSQAGPSRDQGMRRLC